jgi:O-succinylbenzoic acid--CoA ligase
VVVPPDATLPASIAAALDASALDGATPLPPDAALVVPTSGSTGEPHAVVLSHAALAASTAASLAALDCTPGERWVLALPLRHVAGLQVLARARALGTTLHVVTDPGDPHAIAAAAEHAEHIALVPTQLVRCLDAGPTVAAALARFRTVLVGGGPLAPERIAQARAAGVALTLSYGMTETCGGCVYDGRPLPGVDIGVEIGVEIGVDVYVTLDIEQPAPGAEGASGRIRLRGPMLASGYLDPSPTDAARFTPDGWFVTDDVGRLHDDGTLEVLGRADTVINTGGVKVDPVALEALLRTVPGIADVVVLGVPDAEWGERIRAVVVPTDPAQPPTLDSLREAMRTRLPSSHAPRELRIVEAIARDGLGKLSAAERDGLRQP